MMQKGGSVSSKRERRTLFTVFTKLNDSPLFPQKITPLVPVCLPLAKRTSSSVLIYDTEIFVYQRYREAATHSTNYKANMYLLEICMHVYKILVGNPEGTRRRLERNGMARVK
jgi:hypothetical protein